MTKGERGAILGIMAILEANCSSGEVGQRGPTLKEMERYWSEEGEPYSGDSEYDTCQQVWRRLEALL